MTSKPADGERVAPADGPHRLRRNTLACERNSGYGVDYLVELAGTTGSPHNLVHLRYVPDRLLLTPSSFDDYLTQLGQEQIEAPALALAVLEDINNELVPRWVEVAVDANPPAGRVLITDRQPSWDNPALLARLRPW